MIVPNKAIPYNTSLLPKLPLVLRMLNVPMTPADLYHKQQHNFNDLSQFLLTLDILFVLGKIEIVDGELKLC